MFYLNEHEKAYLLEFRNRIEAENILFVALRGYQKLPKSIDNDLDILVSNLCSAEKVAIEAASDIGLSIEIVEKNFKFVGFLINDRIRIDIFCDLLKRWAPYLDADTLLAKRIDNDCTLPHVCAAHHIAMIAAKEVLTYKLIRPRKLLEIQSLNEDSLKNKNKDKVLTALCAYFTYESAKKIVFAAYSKDSNRIVVRRKFTTLFRPIQAMQWIFKRIRYRKWQ